MGPGSFIGIDARIWQALIAGTVVALGWLVNGWRMRNDARQLRRERTRDAHKALFAEIRTVCAAYWNEGEAEVDRNRLVARMEAEPDFVPFIPREVHDRVFETMLPEIDLLPRQTIDVIVSFYVLVRSIETLSDDMRDESFAALSADRRIAIFRDWHAMRARAFDNGQLALRLIETYAENGAEAADALLARSMRLSSRVADRSDREGHTG